MFLNFYRILKLLLFIISVAITGVINLCYAQSPIYFDRITTDNGLSQSDINDIYQDEQGFMWFGTHDGLNKYDGYDFTVYNPDSNNNGSINSNLIFSITGDKNGNLWVGTTGSGLNYFDRSTEKFTQYLYEEDSNNSLSSNHITVVEMDSKDRLWVGTTHGLNLLNTKKSSDSINFQRFNLNHQQLITGTTANNIFSIFEDNSNQIWVGASGGLFKLSFDENGSIYFRLVNEIIGLPNISVRSLHEDKFGRLIIGTEDGLYILSISNNSNRVHRIYDGFFTNILTDNGHHIWAGTNSGLLYFEDKNEKEFPEFKQIFTYDPRNTNSLSKNIVKSLFMDHTGIIWVGTNGGGVNKFDPERKHFRHIKKTSDPKSLSYDNIRLIFEDSNGTLWIGTDGGGLNYISKNDNNGTYSSFKKIEALQKIFAITEIKIGNRKKLLIGTEDFPALYQLDITNPNLINQNSIKTVEENIPSVFALLEDSSRNVWIGTYNGGVHRWLFNELTGNYDKDIIVYDVKNPEGLSNNIIRNIYEDNQGSIWFATGDGLCRLTPKELTKKKPKFDVYKNNSKNKNTISHNYILELYENENGDMWIGTFGGGLNKFIPSSDDQPDRFICFKDKDGLPNNVIKGILEDEAGNLWLSTNKGLSKFNPKNETFKNYDVNDDLQSNEFQELARLKLKNGELLFGGINGFNIFNPKDITDNTVEAETVITNLSISNKPVNIGEKVNGRIILKKSLNQIKEIKIKYKENSFSFDFAALHYAAPQKNQFAYKLDGFDNEWVYTSSNKRFATYTNLEPNTYTLKVKASNNDGVWDSTPAEIKIKVIPPFWRTNVAYALYAFLMLGLLLSYRRFTIIRTTEKHQLELEHFEKEKNEELQQTKLEFFTNISHEFRTPLTLIKGPLKYLQQHGEELEKQVVQQQYSLMQKNTDYLMRLVNQLLDFRKINQGKMRLVMRKSNIIDFIKEVGETFQFLAHKQQIDFYIKSSDDSLYTWFDHDAVEKIVNNLLSNAFKFTPEKGVIMVDIYKENSQPENKESENFIVIKIKDSGPGIPKEKVDTIFERFYTEKDQDKRNPQGVGIGLSFAKNIVELHQGKISVESTINEGTSFIVKLPTEKSSYNNVPEISCKEIFENDYDMRTSESDSFAIGINDEIVDQDLSTSRSNLPVLLVVDDNADIRSFIKQALRTNYTIYEAENGKDGLEKANAFMPNIILTDILMPIMDGIEFCEKIKTKKETSHIPVVMLTAKLSQETEIKGRKTGADGYVRKPFDIELLELKLSNIIKHRGELRKRFNREISLQPKDVTVTSLDERFLQHAIEIVEKHMMNTDFSVEMLVKEMGHSRSNLYLKFKEITGLSSSEFIRNIRLKRAVQLFEKSDLSVKEIMYMTGFNTASYFSKCFKKQFGVIPSEYVKQIQENQDKTA